MISLIKAYTFTNFG